MPALPKQELRQLVAQARTDEAFEQLLELLVGVPSMRKPYNAITLLCGQLRSVTENLGLNLLPPKEAFQEMARINAAVLQYLDELPDQILESKSKTPNPEVALRQSVQMIAADTAWQYDLFFSFSSKDLDAARTFCHALRGHGLRVFFSADDLRAKAGHNFPAVIKDALRQSRHFLLFCSPNAMTSEWVELEHETFFHTHHRPNKKERGFYIAEGPDFHNDLVPDFYRRNQRLQDPETLMIALTTFAPSVAAPQHFNLDENRGKGLEKPSLPQPLPVAQPSAADEHAWEFTTDADTRNGYEKYLKRFPQGFYATDARARLEAFDADNTAWEFADDSGTEKALRKYLSKYPDGLHAAEAHAQLDALQQAREGDAARKRAEEEQAEAERKWREQEEANAREEAARQKREQEKSAAYARSRPLNNHPRYQLHEGLGLGGFSSVYRAWDNQYGLWVAIKVFLKQNEEGVRLCHHEYRRTNMLEHPNIIRLIDFGEDEGSPFIVMPYYAKGSMQDHVGEVTEEALWRLILDIGSALKYMHALQPPVLHNDLKPDNFLIADDGSYILCDFGVSFELTERLLRSRDLLHSDEEEFDTLGMGAMAYQAPELFHYRDQKKQRPAEASEIWAFGACLYEMASGEPPFGQHGGLYQLMQTKDHQKQMHELCDPLPSSFSGLLNDLILDCLRTDVQERPTASSLVETATRMLSIGGK